jgi:hypothetical protein
MASLGVRFRSCDFGRTFFGRRLGGWLRGGEGFGGEPDGAQARTWRRVCYSWHDVPYPMKSWAESFEPRTGKRARTAISFEASDGNKPSTIKVPLASHIYLR